MEPKLLLIKAVTMLYREALIKPPESRSTALANEVLGIVHIPPAGGEFHETRERLMALKNTVSWMAESTDPGPFMRNSVLQRIRLASDDDETVYMAFLLGLGEDDNDKDDILKQIEELKYELRDAVKSVKVKEIFKDMYLKAFQGLGSNVGTDAFLKEAKRRLDDVGAVNTGKRIKGMVDEMYLGQPESSSKIIQRAKESLSSEGALIFGQQALNDLTYDHGAALRGEYWLIAALSHHYKSGIGYNVFIDLALFNKPWMIDKTKKPLLVHISTEDNAEKAALFVYQLLWEREHGRECSIKDIDPDVAAAYIKERLEVNGYECYMMRIDGGSTTVNEIEEHLEYLESLGYEIHACVFDYPPMLSREGLVATTAGEDLRDIHRRLRGIFGKRKTLCVAFHQLGPKAYEVWRAKNGEFVSNVAGNGMYDGSSKIYQEPDVDIIMAKEEAADGSWWLVCQCDKHRKVKTTPSKYWYFAMQLHPYGGLIPDIKRTPEGEIIKLKPNYVRDMKPMRAKAGDWFQEAGGVSDLF